MSPELLARVGAVVAAGGLAVLLVGTVRWQRLAGLGAWAVGMVLFVPLLAPAGKAVLVAAAGAAALALAGGLAVVFRRWPWSVAALALLAIPARIPVTVGETSAKLLLPLYAVVAGAALTLAWSLVRDPARARELGPLTWPAALFVAWTALSALWAQDVAEGAVTLFFFVLPFGLLALVVARLPWSPRALVRLAALLFAMAVAFAAVGIWQWVAREVFWNERVIASNAFRSFHRVNSVFWDPSMYGRFLVVALLVALVLVVFGACPRLDPALALGVVVVWVGLVFSFSQSSFLALLVGLALVAVLAWRWRAGAAALALCAVVALSVGFAAPTGLRANIVDVSAAGLERATSGRTDLVRVGVGVALDHPVLGLGVGGFERAYEARAEGLRRFEEPASHNTVVTVAAETGLVGLSLFVLLLGAALAGGLRRRPRGEAAIERTRLAAGVALVAVFVHSLFYDAFLEDSTTWILLGLVALAVAAGGEETGRPARLASSRY